MSRHTKRIRIEAVPAGIRAKLKGLDVPLTQAVTALIRGVAEQREGGTERLAAEIRAGQASLLAGPLDSAKDLSTVIDSDAHEFLKAAADALGVKMYAAARFLLIARAGRILETVQAGTGWRLDDAGEVPASAIYEAGR